MSNFTKGYALIIGVGVDLPMTVTDATGIKNILIDQNKAAYDPKNVILLTENDADRKSILQAFQDLIGKSKQNPDATVIIYYSGHGGVKEKVVDGKKVEEYFLVPSGFDQNDIENTAISGEEFKEKIEKIDSRKMLVLLDCCHAEGVVKKSVDDEISYKDKFFNENFINKTPEKLIETLGTGSGRITVASSRADEFSLAYRSDTYSVFTKHLIAALSGSGSNNSDEYIKLFSVLDYLFEKVPEQTDDKQNPIVSSIENLTENFPICYYEGGKKSVSGNNAILPAPANLQTIWGTIYDQNQNSLPGIEIRIREHEIKTETNRHGDFWLRNVPPEVNSFTANYHNKDTDFQINQTKKYEVKILTNKTWWEWLGQNEFAQKATIAGFSTFVYIAFLIFAFFTGLTNPTIQGLIGAITSLFISVILYALFPVPNNIKLPVAFLSAPAFFFLIFPKIQEAIFPPSTRTIKGTVTEINTNTRVFGASVRIPNSSINANTAPNGEFTLDNVPKKEKYLEIIKFEETYKCKINESEEPTKCEIKNNTVDPNKPTEPQSLPKSYWEELNAAECENYKEKNSKNYFQQFALKTDHINTNQDYPYVFVQITLMRGEIINFKYDLKSWIPITDPNPNSNLVKTKTKRVKTLKTNEDLGFNFKLCVEMEKESQKLTVEDWNGEIWFEKL